MGRIDITLEGLGKIAVRDDLVAAPPLLRKGLCPEVPEGKHLLPWSHVGPNTPTRLVRRIRPRPDLALEVALCGLAWHVYASTGDVKLPAVVNAAQACLL